MNHLQSNQYKIRRNNIGKEKRSLLLSFILCIMLQVFIGISDDLFITILRFAVCGVFSYCVYKAQQQAFIMNVYLLFSITPMSLLLYSEKISPYYLNRLSSATFGLALINMVAFLVAYTKTRKKSSLKFGKYQATTAFDIEVPLNLSIKKICFHSYLLCLIGQFPTICKILFNIEIPFKSIIGFFSYIGIAFAFKSKKKLTIIICLLFLMTNYLDDFNKTRLLYLVMIVLVCMEVYVVKTQKDRLRLLGGIILAAVLIVLVAFPLKSFIRNGGNYFLFLKNASQISSTAFAHYQNRISFNGPSVLEMPYMYLVSAWNNVQYVMESQNTRTYGLWMLKPLLGYLQIDGIFDNYYELIPYSTFNTFTYISVLFKDFGYYGSILGSFFLGFYVKRIALKVKKEGSAFDTAAYALVAMATLEMFFTNHFFSLSYPFTIVIIGYLYKKIFKLSGY